MLTALLAGFLGIVVLGLGSFQNNIATESAGRILDKQLRLSPPAFMELFGDASINPYTATASQVMELLTTDALDPTIYGPPLYDERKLILSPAEWTNRSELPALNQLLVPSYVFDPDLIPDGGTIKELIDILGLLCFARWAAIVTRQFWCPC